MSEIKRVKIQNFVETQIPEFLNDESPLFKEFLTQYYISQEYQTGIVDLANNLTKYKSIDNFNNETFYSNLVPCVLNSDIKALDSEIFVNHTVGFPEKYGLFKIGTEIITYTGKTSNSFTGCVRGFSGIDSLDNNSLSFSTTAAVSHLSNDVVENLTLLFFNKLFDKFKYQFLPGFENRNFYDGISIKNILSGAREFYSSKGTDISYKTLFKILYNKDIEVIKPIDYTLKTSNKNYLTVKNILLEKISGGDPLDLMGKTIFQGEVSSAAIYNIQIRPVEEKFLYEVSLDSESITVPFSVTNKTNILKKVSSGDTSLTVDSTIGFPTSGDAFIISKFYEEPVKISYQDKSSTQFFGVSGIDFDFGINDEVVSDNFAVSYLDDGSLIEFRVISIISDFDLSRTSNLRTGDKIVLSNFGRNLEEFPNFYCWKYNVPVTTEISSISEPFGSNQNIWNIKLYDNIRFYINEEIVLINENNPDDIEDRVIVIGINEENNTIQVQTDIDISQKNKIKKEISYASSYQNYFSDISLTSSCIQNTYVDLNDDYFYVASTGVPDYTLYAKDRNVQVIGNTDDTLITSQRHRLYTGEKIYYFSSNPSGISSGIYFVNTVGDVSDSFRLNLSYSKSDLFNNKFIEFKNSLAGDYFVKLDYENKTLKNQKLLKKFNFKYTNPLTEESGERSTNNKTVGMLCNGIELYSPSLYDENLYYGELDSVLITDRGRGYDVINNPATIIEDELGSGASLHLNLTGSLKEVKVVKPGIGYELKPKISLVGGNGSGAIIKSNLAKQRIYSSFRGDGFGVNTALNIITFTDNHNFNDCEEVLYDSNGNESISYEEIIPSGVTNRRLSNNAAYFVKVISSNQVKLFRTLNDCVYDVNPIQFRALTSGVHYLKTLKSKNTITQIYVEDPGSGYSNKKVIVDSVLSADNLTNGVNTFDNYIFAKDHNFKNKDLVNYSYQTSSISGLSTSTLYSVTVLDKNRFKLSETGYEDKATNLIKYSQNLDNAFAWQRGGILLIQPNVEIAPDGTKTADLVIANTTNSAHRIFATIQGNILTLNNIFTLSVFVKKYGSYRYFQISGAGSHAANEAPVFDLDTGTVINPTTNVVFKNSKIEYYGNGWYRCSVVYDSDLENNIYLNIRDNTSFSGGPFTGDGTSGFYMWGAQVQSGPDLSSYVSTFDTIRTRDVIEAKFDNYNNKVYVDFDSLGSGRQTFSYPPIKLRIEVQSGITSSIEVEPVLEPVVIGSAESVFVIDKGQQYGTPDIINFHRRPNIFTSKSTSIPQIKPVILDNKIIDVQILSQGSGLTKAIDIEIAGNGSFADLYPVVEGGKLVDVKVLNSGINYDAKTKLTIVDRGVGVQFIGNIKEWKINQVEKNKDLINYDLNRDEGIIVPSKNSNLGLTFVNFYPPKELRKQIRDNINSSDSKEQSSNLTHSPIIGWSYDGNPIYGPYGQVGSDIRKVESSYYLDVESNTSIRPNFPDGFFIQDYKFDRSYGDLDEYNGRYCRTPDFPEGTYAYFYTIDDNSLSNPIYPYIIADKTKDTLIQENYDLNINQDYDISSLNLIRNTSPYYVNSSKTSSTFLNSIDPKYQQIFSVNQVLSSYVEKVNPISPGDNYKVGDNIIFDNFETYGSGLTANISEVRGKELTSIGINSISLENVSFVDSLNSVVGISTIPHNLVTGDVVYINSVKESKYKELEGSQKIFVFQKSVGLIQDIPSVSTGLTTSILVNDTVGFESGDLIKVNSEIMRITNVSVEESSFYVDRLSDYGTHSAGISSVVLLPNKFTFTKPGINYGIRKNKKVFFDPTSLVGFGTTGSNYTNYKNENVYIRPKSIFIKNHNFYTGQELIYNVGLSGNGFLVSESTEASSFRLSDNQKVYAVNYGQNYLGISTVGFTSSVGIGSTFNSLYFYNTGTTGKSDSLSTNYESVTAKVENYYIDATTLSDHNLKSGDKISLNLIPDFIDTYYITYDQTLRKIVTNILSFPSTSVDLSTSEIVIEDNLLKTGQKVVYYSNGNSSISDLEDNKTYYIIKTSFDRIRFAKTYYDSINGIYITLRDSSSGTHKIGFINPPILINKGNILKFDLSDSSLSEMDIKLYKDVNFIKELEDYRYTRNSILSGFEDSYALINTKNIEDLNEIFYNLIPNTPLSVEKRQISSDLDVLGRNKIIISTSNLNQNYSIISTGSTSFKINLNDVPEKTTYTISSGINSIFYSTNSSTASGPIDRIKINFAGKGYKKLPSVLNINSESGNGAIIKSLSKTIGKVDSFERVKDGYDYPTDPTLKPYLNTPTVASIKGISRIGSVGIITGGSKYNNAPYLVVNGNPDVKLSCELQGGSVTKVNILKNVNNLEYPLEIYPTKNSNGYDIDNITVSGNYVTLELVNSDTQIYPLIANSYGGTEIDFPFSVGDDIFIENCRIQLTETDKSGNLIPKDNYNSSDYDYNFFKVVGVSTEFFTVTYDMTGYSVDFGEYSTNFGYGYVTNKKLMAKFVMNLSDDLSYFSNEKVFGYSPDGTNVFSGEVMDGGWDGKINELRIKNSKGILKVGDKLFGTSSKLNGIVENTNTFNIPTSLGVTRDSTIESTEKSGELNNYQQRISDNDYYQKFSYSIQSEIPYSTWREPVRTIIHPAGFKEFSDLNVISSSNMNMGALESTSSFIVNVDSESSMYQRNNFTIVSEDFENQFDDGSIDRIDIGAEIAYVSGIGFTGPVSGVALQPYILNNTNKVVKIDDISDQFNGSSNYEVIGIRTASFSSYNKKFLGISTSGIEVGDYVGFSSYLIPDLTYVTSIGINSVGINIPHSLLQGTSESEIIKETSVRIIRTIDSSLITGISSFKLKENGIPLFYREFDSSDSNIVNLTDNKFNIENHNFQVGQKITYTSIYGSAIGIATTSSTESSTPIIISVGNTSYLSVQSSDSSIITSISGGIGSALYENGYNVSIDGPIVGTSASVVPDFSGLQNNYFGYPYGFPQKSSTGIGTGAKFSAFIVYNSTTGQPISTSIILNSGGSGYSIGDTVSISGTFFGGNDGLNDLSFNVSKVSSTRISSEANNFYLNVQGSNSGLGTNAIFNVYRDTNGDLDRVEIVDGGVGYALTDRISIFGSNIGGADGIDDIFISPVGLGTNKLPPTLYINSCNDDSFKVSGLQTDGELDLVALGNGIHSFEFDNANASTLIMLDNIIQSPLFIRDINVSLASSIGLGTDLIYLNSGITSITSLDTLKINDEYFKIENIGIGSINEVKVERAFFGSSEQYHDSTSEVTLYRGDFNIVDDVIYFSTPPYGKIGPEGLQVNSSFQGRLFSRKFDPGTPNDKNIILDDISQYFTGSDITVGIITGTLDSSSRNIISGISTSGLAIGDYLIQTSFEDRFIQQNTRIDSIGSGSIQIFPSHNVRSGIATTEFSVKRLSYILKSNKENVIGIYTNTNTTASIFSSGNINNNPIILINNIPQISGTDYIIDTENQNTFKFISGIPNAGRIVRVGINSGFGYQPLVGAAATVTVSPSGTISNITLTGYGSGYRTEPVISLISTQGSGAEFSASIGLGGTITSLSIVNSGAGYTSNPPPNVIIDLPNNYSDLPLDYISGTSGDGFGAKASVVVGYGSSIVGFELEDSGLGYKVGDILTISGITTDPTFGPGFEEFRIYVEEIFTDKFSGFYPGQFLQFDDISSLFNGSRKKFTITITENGVKRPVNLKISPSNTLNIENNLFIYINDILQEPLISYTFSGSRILFKEPPLKGSKCNVMFFKGSDLDVEQIDPPKTLKEGDKVIIQENILEPTDRTQFERVIKGIVSVDAFDTFTYNDIGINTDPTKSRPLTWIKQTQDRIINGSLQSKSRPDLKSRVTPNAKLIKSISRSDRFIYVDNAFPIFSAVDNISEELSDVVIVQDREISAAIGTAIVSSGSTLSEISINFAGVGYIDTISPEVSISSAFIKKKDPIYNWQFGIAPTSDNFNYASYGDNLVSVGQSGLVGYSQDGINWDVSNIGYGASISFNAIISISTNKYISVGENSKIVSAISTGSSLVNWTEYPLSILVPDANSSVQGEVIKQPSEYLNTFNDLVYSPVQDKVVAVGNSSGAFVSVGISSDEFLQQNSRSFDDLLSITNNDIIETGFTSFTNSRFVSVGKNGSIVISSNGTNWSLTDSRTTNNLNKVIWDGIRFIAVGDNSTILTSGIDWNWTPISSNLSPSEDIKNIKYYEDFYVILTTNQKLYYSFDLEYWLERSTNQLNQINDLIFVNNFGPEGRYVGIGSNGTVIYAEPIFNRATATSSVTGGIVTSTSIINPGFGYIKSEPPPVLFESDSLKSEKIVSYKVKGDFGNIVNVSVGSSTIDFELKSEYYDGPSIGAGIGYSSLNRYNILYSQLQRGDYFTISDSSPTVGHSLTCIDLDSGGLDNYPDSIVGTATTYLDGVYRVSDVIGTPTELSGITTVRCHFAYAPGGGSIQVDTLDVTNSVYGKYSWSVFYDFENRLTSNSNSFAVNTNSGLSGLTTSPSVYRTRGLI